MSPIVTKNILRFAALLFLQVLVIDHIQISSMVTPFIYILAIIMLPFNTPRWLLLFSAFVLGFLVDIFSGTMGLNMSATLTIAFVRPYVLNLISFGRDYEDEEAPNMKNLGVDWFVAYVSIMIVIHHSAIFFLEVFRLSELGTTFLRIIYSSLATFVLVFLWQFLFALRKG
ncbi:MAG: rod shape-determining protein MreD [Bacteroidales bacterium]|nr:rod shape-determining protein MreD [Bacteroidales bacterium]